MFNWLEFVHKEKWWVICRYKGLKTGKKLTKRCVFKKFGFKTKPTLVPKILKKSRILSINLDENT